MAPTVITAAGQTATPIVRRAGKDRVYQVDCRAPLRQHELLVHMATEPAPGLGMQCQARPARGARTLHLQLSGGELPQGQVRDNGAARPAVVTTQGVIELAVAVRMAAQGPGRVPVGTA